MATAKTTSAALEAAAATDANASGASSSETQATVPAAPVTMAPTANLVQAKEGSVPPGAGSWKWMSNGTPEGTGWLPMPN